MAHVMRDSIRMASLIWGSVAPESRHGRQPRDADVEGTKKEFLVVYDYGSGGLWGVMRAKSAEEILAKYPELSVTSERRAWLTDIVMAEIRRAESHDIDDEPSGLLEAVLADRSHH